MCYQAGASWEMSSCSPKYLTRTTTERVPARGGGGIWSPVKSLRAVGSEDDGYYMWRPKRLPHTSVRARICEDIGRRCPRGSKGSDILQRGSLYAFLWPVPRRLNMPINLWRAYGMCKCLQARVCSGRSEHTWQPPCNPPPPPAHSEKNGDGLKYFISAIYVSANLHSIW